MRNLFLSENYDSIHLHEKVNILTEEQIRAIDKGLKWTINNMPSAVLIGGTALVHYLNGGRDLTPDIDFLVPDIDQVKQKINETGIKYTELAGGNSGLIGVSIPSFNTDYLDAEKVNPALNNLILQTAKMAKIGGYNVKIITPELLAIMKIELGREKDTDDGFKLLMSGVLDKEKYLNYVNNLKNNLNDYESLVSYADMIY